MTELLFTSAFGDPAGTWIYAFFEEFSIIVQVLTGIRNQPCLRSSQLTY